jgi:hypothetical protein
MGSRIGINLPQIFPQKESAIVWPPQSLSHFEVELIGDAFQRVIDGASRGMLGNRIV